MNDNQLDQLLAEFRNKKPNDMQVHRWKKAVREELQSNVKKPQSIWLQLLVASLTGFIIGGVVFSYNPFDASTNLAQLENENATFEYVYTKIN